MRIFPAHFFRQTREEFLGGTVGDRMFGKNRAAVKRKHSLDLRNLFKLHVVKDAFVDEKHHAVGVVYDVLCILHIEIVEHRDDHCTVGECCHIDDHP